MEKDLVTAPASGCTRRGKGSPPLRRSSTTLGVASTAGAVNDLFVVAAAVSSVTEPHGVLRNLK